MSIVINAPTVESRLHQEAAKHGVSPAEYAVQILSTHLGPNGTIGIGQVMPFYATATPEQWVAEFDNWVDGHPKRTALPEHAFDRETFYEGRP